MAAGPIAQRRSWFVGICLAVCLAACGSPRAVHRIVVAPPTATSTVAVGFAVDVTAAPLPTSNRSRAQPTPTHFVPPRGSYIALFPSSGPPAARSITVRGGHLPAGSAVQLHLAASGSTAPIAKTAYTSASGTLQCPFLIPSTSPGIYTITAVSNGRRLASASYRVTSNANLAVTVTPTGKGFKLRVEGRRFLAQLHLLLVAYPMVRGEKPLILGTARASPHGSFTVTRVSRKLHAGQYVLRAYAANMLSSQMAEAFFEVVI